MTENIKSSHRLPTNSATQPKSSASFPRRTWTAGSQKRTDSQAAGHILAISFSPFCRRQFKGDRLRAARDGREFIELHRFGSDVEVDAGSRRPVQTDRKCEKCGAPMVLVREPHGIYVGCRDYPKCQNHYSIRRGDRIGTDDNGPGKDSVACGKPMVAVSGKFGE
jgi:hypothetical protein